MKDSTGFGVFLVLGFIIVAPLVVFGLACVIMKVIDVMSKMEDANRPDPNCKGKKP